MSMTILYEIHDILRFPRVQEFASYCRLVRCTKESAGKITGLSHKKIGNVHLKWAFSEVAVQFLRCHPKARSVLNKIERKHGKGKALSILAHKLGRATYYMWMRRKTFDFDRFANA